MSKVRMPKVGDNINQALTVAVKDINKALPSLQVNSDLGGTSIVHTSNGAVVHSKDIHLYPNVNMQIPLREIPGIGFWNSATGSDISLKLIMPYLDPEDREWYYQEQQQDYEQYIEFLNKLGLSMDQSPYRQNVVLMVGTNTNNLNSEYYLSSDWFDIGELILPGLQATEGRQPLRITWTGPTIYDTKYTFGAYSKGISAIVTQGTEQMWDTNHTEWMGDGRHIFIPSGRTDNINISLYLSGYQGANIISPSAVEDNYLYVTAPHKNGRGLLFYNGTTTEEGNTINTTYCSGLFYGDRQHPATTTGTAEFYNWYTSIKSEEVTPRWEDPDNPGEYIEADYSEIYLSLYDITPCLSCGQNNGIVQSIETIYNKRADGTSSPTLGVNRYITQLDLQPVYKQALNVITGRPSTGDYVLSSHNGTMSWQVNSGGGPGPGPTPTTDEVYITEQDEITAAFNTTYNVIQMHDLSATQPDTYGCSQDYVYKHFVWSPSYGSGNYVLTTTLTTRDGQRWYGGTFNGTWHEYTSDGVGAIIKIPPATTNCKITINTFEYGDCVLSCINGSRIIFADTSDQITGFFYLGRGTQFVMVWDTYMNNWQGFLNS